MNDKNERERFDIPADLAYLNTANIGPRLKTVSQAGHQAIERFSTPWEISATDWFSGAEALRALFATLIGVDTDAIALVPAASYGIAIAAKNLPLPKGSHIVVVEEQYPSNIYAWQRRCREAEATIRVAERTATRSITETLLSKIDRDTAIVAIPHCHWTDGEIFDLVAIAEAARAVNAALVIDASQSLGAVPLDFSSVQPDFVVAVGYKWLLGPYGLGYLYVSPHWQGAGIPLEESWLNREGSEDFSRLVDYVDTYRPGARRFDFGEFPQFISLPMATAAISQLATWGVPNIYQTLTQRTQQIRAFAESIGLDVLSAERCAGHMLGLKAQRGFPADTLERLKAKGVHVSLRGDKIRVAPHLHNSEQDMQRFFAALQALLRS